MKKILRQLLELKPTMNVAAFAFFYSVLNVVLYHGPLLRFAAGSLDLHSAGGLSAMFGMTVALLAALFIVLIVLSVIPGVMKPVSALLLIGNAAAFSFVVNYNVILDRTMMGNVFNTNFGETSELLGWKLFGLVFVLGVLPAAAVMRVRLTPVPLRRKAALLGAVLMAVTALTYFNSRSWLWFDKNSKRIGGLLMPFSYICNSVRYWQYQAFLNGVDERIPDAAFTGDDKVTVVLVIGESARRAEFSLYGYKRPTNPLLAGDDVAALPKARTLSTYTTESIRLMLAHLGERTPGGKLYEALPSYLQRHGVNVLWRSNNWGEPKLHIARYEKADELRKRCGAACGETVYDEAMLYGLKEELAAGRGRNNLIILHQMGSHGPLYNKRYPADKEIFKPVCGTVDLQKCTKDELVNAYDNTVVYTDRFLHGVIADLRSMKNTPSVMIYLSDHGESLGEYNIYLHGTPFTLAPDVQKDVPFIVWMSDEFKRRRHLKTSDLLRETPHSQNNIFPSVMGAFGMRSPFYDAGLDIFNINGK